MGIFVFPTFLFIRFWQVWHTALGEIVSELFFLQPKIIHDLEGVIAEQQSAL